MKTIIYTILILFTITISYSQNQNQLNFIGDWEWENGNQTFTVHLFYNQDENIIQGDYNLTETTGTGMNAVTTLIYKSNFTPMHNGYAIFAGARSLSEFGGSIIDNVLAQNTNFNKCVKYGDFSMKIINNTSGNTTATWKVTGRYGLIVMCHPLEFTIPTDIILTKTN